MKNTIALSVLLKKMKLFLYVTQEIHSVISACYARWLQFIFFR